MTSFIPKNSPCIIIRFVPTIMANIINSTRRNRMFGLFILSAAMIGGSVQINGMRKIRLNVSLNGDSNVWESKMLRKDMRNKRLRKQQKKEKKIVKIKMRRK